MRTQATCDERELALTACTCRALVKVCSASGTGEGALILPVRTLLRTLQLAVQERITSRRTLCRNLSSFHFTNLPKYFEFVS